MAIPDGEVKICLGKRGPHVLLDGKRLPGVIHVTMKQERGMRAVWHVEIIGDAVEVIREVGTEVAENG